LVGVVGPLLAVEIDLGVARLKAVGVLRLVASVLGLKTLSRGQALDQRAVDAEVLAAQARGQRLTHHCRKEGLGQFVIVEPAAIVAKGRRVEGLLAWLQIEKPAEQQVGVDALAELPLASSRRPPQPSRLQSAYRS
jgi:hypothetical protein